MKQNQAIKRHNDYNQNLKYYTNVTSEASETI